MLCIAIDRRGGRRQKRSNTRRHGNLRWRAANIIVKKRHPPGAGDVRTIKEAAMRKRDTESRIWLCCCLALSVPAGVVAGEMRFAHHVVENWTGPDGGSWGQTALVDVDRDGDLDFIMARQGGVVLLYEFQAADRWVRHQIGDKSPSDVGGVALDVDRDGWTDLVLGGAWLRNPGKESLTKPWPRYDFDPALEAVHDVVAADVDGDGRPEIVTMSDRNDVRWYDVPDDPTQPWPKTVIGKSVHAGLAAGDLDSDGDVDVVRSTAWFENQDRGARWIEHRLHADPWPESKTAWQHDATRAAVVDVNRDGRADVILTIAEIAGAQIAWFEGPAEPKAAPWPMHVLPQAAGKRAPYHSLAVADFDNDGDLDLFSGEMESIPGEGPPRWFVWENADGKGDFHERVILDGNLGTHEVVAGDIEGDGDADLVGKPWRAHAGNAIGGRLHVDFLENLTRSK